MRKLVELPAWILIGLIRLYQRSIAPLLTPRCRFYPSCSEYAIEAIRFKGLVRGGMLGLWRLARCGPWTRGGIDPVKTRRTTAEAG